VTPPRGLAIWIAAARPKTLWAAVAPVLMGTAMAYADGGFHVPSATCALLFALSIQIGTNFCNDLADYLKGADTEHRKGPLRVTQAGLVTPAAMRTATILVFSVAFAIGVYLVARAGWTALAIVVLAVLCGVLYTAGPLPLGYVGLGEIFVLIFFGPVAVAGTYLVQALDLRWEVIAAGSGAGLLSVAILVVNNLRDADEDARAGKRTLAVRFGKSFARFEYAACLAGAVAIPGAMVLVTGQRPYCLLSCLILLPALTSVRKVFALSEGALLNPVLGETARLLLTYSVLFSIGWLIR
jgi:1,4-dihydroxy-2-naphthoate polyprenyltransferase